MGLISRVSSRTYRDKKLFLKKLEMTSQMALDAMYRNLLLSARTGDAEKGGFDIGKSNHLVHQVEERFNRSPLRSNNKRSFQLAKRNVRKSQYDGGSTNRARRKW